MAAGIGSRYGGLKQIDPVGPNGEIMLDYSVFDALRAGFGKVVFIIRRDIEAEFKSVISSHFRDRVPVEYVFQSIDNIPEGFSVPEGRTKPWGTGQAVLACKDVVKEPFAVINADDFYGKKSYEIIYSKLINTDPASNEYCLAGFELSKTLSEHGHVARGICSVDDNSNLTSIVERLKIEKTDTGARFLDDDGNWYPLTGGETASMNMFGFTPTLFAYLEAGFVPFMQKSAGELKSEYLLPAVVGDLLGAGKISLKVLNSPERWFGVTYREDKEVVVNNIKRLTADGVYPDPLW
ncbi:MAG: nucleotidyltransferase [Lentisphaerae bacterium]|nr:nucleotidyltransferase [Lentisphaerota bacterium]